MRWFRRYGVGVALMLAGVAFLVIGALRGEAETVFRRAANICMECIGLG